MTTREDEIRARLEAATPGPWGLKGCSHGGAILKRGGDWGQSVQIVPLEDAEFIAHAPEDIAYLLREVGRWQDYIHRHHIGVDSEMESAEEIKRLRAEIEKLKGESARADFERQLDDRGYP